MNNQKFILFVVIFSLFILILPGFVYAAGCCIDASLGACTNVALASECQTEGRTYVDGVACETACAQVCCCDFSNACDVNIDYSCIAPDTSCAYTGSGDVGDSCSCTTSNNYNVSGTIRNSAGGVVSGATVSAAGATPVTSASGGTYTLIDATASSAVIVTAHKISVGCVPATRTIDLSSSNQANVDITLSCTCVPETCNATLNAYCKSDSTWQVYNILNPLEKINYCNFCSVDDSADCGSVNVCVGGNAECPLICSAISTDSNYDSDCVCNSTVSNNFCPPGCASDEFSSNFDIDCNIYSPICGDRIVTYPYETCEDNPFDGQLNLCSAHDCANPSELGACNCLSLSGCGNGIFEPALGEQCEIGMICTDGVLCENCECGTPTCTGNLINPELQISFNSQQNKNDVSWTLLTSCIPSVSNYAVYKCEKQVSSDCSDKGVFSLLAGNIHARSLTDSAITESSEYCYFVKAFYRDGAIGESRIQCEKTGSYYCMESHPPEFCINNARSECDNSNNIRVVEDCKPDKFCMGPDLDGATHCLDQGLCDMCNGMYGVFSNLDLKIQVQEGEYYVFKYCKPGTGREAVEGCYIDRTKTLFSAFDYCAEIASCYDFKSEDACEDPTDPCDKNQICDWEWLDSNSHELGGVCRPNAIELQKCELCDDEDYNWLTPGCTPATCSLFGECYYQGRSSTRINAEPCTKQITANCLDYTDTATCTNGVPVHINAIYNANNERVSGSHALAPASDDILGLGKCYWDSVNSRCLRNADNNPVRDCRIGDYYCESDFRDPKTSILPSNFGVYPADVNIRFSVADNYPSNKIISHFCVSDGVCYPRDLADNANGIYSTTIDTSGVYNVYYYSYDPAKNLEIVKNTQILVDTIPPSINLTSPSDPSNFPTNQNIVPAVGVTSTDSKFICAQNTRSLQTLCVNNCLLTGNDPALPCFSNQTGIFEIDIHIGNDNLTQVVFFAEDFAGNTYRNTLLGVLLDIDPPDEADINVYPVI